MSEGFFSRWSRRKEAVREGQPVEPEPAKEVQPDAVLQPATPVETSARAASAEPPPPPPTLEDTHALTLGDDFTRFVQPDVTPEVKNAALKKLFADPHFNQMDGLDVYIDDYGKPDPLPASMARKLASAQFLKLFEEKEDEASPQAAPTHHAAAHDEAGPAQAREVADNAPLQSVAESDQDAAAVSPPPHHADPDLRLQQDHAPGRAGPGQGTE